MALVTRRRADAGYRGSEAPQTPPDAASDSPLPFRPKAAWNASPSGERQPEGTTKAPQLCGQGTGVSAVPSEQV